MAEELKEEGGRPPSLAVVGGGVAGCAAAVWAARNGAEVTLINEGLPLGGQTYHTTTLPARVMMEASKDLHRAKAGRFPGLQTSTGEFEWGRFRTFQQRLVREQSEFLRREVLDTKAVRLVEGRARFRDEKSLEVGTGEVVEADRILLTPGARIRPPAIRGLAKAEVMAIGELLGLDVLPSRLIFLGASPTALAFAQALGRLGLEVTLCVENEYLLPHLLDRKSARALETILAEEGCEVLRAVEYDSIQRQGGVTRLRGKAERGGFEIESDRAVYVDHRQPNLEELNLRDGGVALTESGYIVVDETLQTSNPRVFAAGDAIGRGYQASASAYDATLAARNAVERSPRAGHTTVVPFAIYTDPEFAGVGWTAAQAREVGFEPEEIRLDFQEIPAAAAMGSRQGYVELCRDPRTDQLLGARILAPHASELIMEAAIAIRAGLTTRELAGLVHPSVSLGHVIGITCQRFHRAY